MKTRTPAPIVQSTGRKAFHFLLVSAWVCSVLTLKWDERWLYALLGVIIIAGSFAGRRQPAIVRVLLLLPLVFPVWNKIHSPAWRVGVRDNTTTGTQQPAESVNDAPVISALVTAEETLLTLAPKMSALSKALLDLRLPGTQTEAESVFARTVSVTDVGPAPAMSGASEAMLEIRSWPMASTAEVAQVDLWRPLLDAVSWFEHAKVYLTSGEHPQADMNRFEAMSGFEALARMKTGEWRSLHGKIKLNWQRGKTAAGEPAPFWQITHWKTEEMHWTASPKRMFVEALDSVLRPPQEVSKLRRSQHYEATVKYYREGMKTLPHPYFAPISVNQKEGVSVVDIDGDGFDDIYITVRLGKNMLLHNHGDGTFTEDAAAFGLDLPGHTTCALFADFDNDGDVDVMLGRSLLKTTYLENRGGHFYQLPIPSYMPMAVISMAAADYNGDGLLDVYLCTYRPAAPVGASPAGGVAQVNEGAFDWPDEFFSPELAKEYKRKVAEYTKRHSATVLDQLGPPNVLLVNRGGGHFEVAPENSTVGIWRNSLQATWCDYNGDGKPDLYIANDWGLDVLFRNDGSAGFTDVSTESGITSYGFAMGASWGDYDNDGREDIYVSNMYSEAGRRITGRIPGLSKMFVESASGNYLYHGEAGGKFKQIAGLEPPAMTVMNSGWSWGGGFADFDNDSFLDLYVLSGYFTAPKELSSGLDLESNLWRTMVRSDEKLSRSSFRFSPEWKRTPAPDNLGPQIDARLAGVDRQGDKVLVHSLNGNERNHFFANRGGRSFVDVSGLSGLDNPADSRGFAVLDYDRDGWQDIALVNANQPLFNLYHNEMPKAGRTGGMIAIRFVGGNRTSAPSKLFACRDGYGARVSVDLGDEKLIREHRCGDGWAAQNSATMIIGIGAHKTVASISVRWPSSKTSTTQAVPEGTLLTVYENPADSPSGEAFSRNPYRIKQTQPTTTATIMSAKPIFPVRALDTTAKPARLHVYTSFATSSPSSTADLPKLRRLKEELSPDGVDIVAVPIDESDDNPKLGAFAKQWKPTSRLANIVPAKRAEVVTAYTKALDQETPVPSTVITDDTGHILSSQPGVPSISEVRKLLAP